MHITFVSNHPTKSRVHDDSLTQLVLDKVRAKAKERKLKVPSRSAVGGSYGTYVYISYPSLVMKDLILEVLKEEGIALYPASK